MQTSYLYYARDEKSTFILAQSVAKLLPEQFKIYLHGELGAGKTSFVRGVLRTFGYKDVINSPTYTLVETYRIAQNQFCHLDLYRLNDPMELEFIGIRDYFDESICFVEWAERGDGFLPKADVDCYITIPISGGRKFSWKANSLKGQVVLQELLKL